MVTYIVADTAFQAARYRRVAGLDCRRTRTILWPSELEAADARAARIVFLRGWSAQRSQADARRLRAAADAMHAAGAPVVESAVDEDTVFRLESLRPLPAA